MRSPPAHPTGGGACPGRSPECRDHELFARPKPAGNMAVSGFGCGRPVRRLPHVRHGSARARRGRGVRDRRGAPPPLPGRGVGRRPDEPRGRLRAGRPAGPGLHGPGRDLRPRRRGAAVPARRDATGLHRRRVGPHRRGRGPAGPCPRGVPRRRLQRRPHPLRRRRPPPRRHQLPGVPASRPRGQSHQRGPHPRGRDRRGARRGRRVPRPRGQPPLPVGRELRPGQPGGHGPGAARGLLGPAHRDGV